MIGAIVLIAFTSIGITALAIEETTDMMVLITGMRALIIGTSALAIVLTRLAITGASTLNACMIADKTGFSDEPSDLTRPCTSFRNVLLFL